MRFTSPKDPSIKSLVQKLERQLGSGMFKLVDDWDADLFAVGMVRQHDPDRRVYVSSWRQGNGRYSIHLELGAELAERTVTKFDNVSYREAVALIKKHLDPQDRNIAPVVKNGPGAKHDQPDNKPRRRTNPKQGSRKGRRQHSKG